MKKTERFNMKVETKFLEELNLVCSMRPGIRTKTAAIEYCVETVVMQIKKEKENKDKTGGEEE